MDYLEKVLKDIHKHCLRCCGGSWKDVENCQSGPDAAPFSSCVLWIYRLGTIIVPDERKRKGE